MTIFHEKYLELILCTKFLENIRFFYENILIKYIKFSIQYKYKYMKFSVAFFPSIDILAVSLYFSEIFI